MISRERFLDLVGVTSIIPGPNSTEMAIHLGFVRGGWLGLILAGGCFIIPAVTLTTLLAWAYVQYGAVAHVAWLLYGIKPAVLAVILGAGWRLGKNAMKGMAVEFSWACGDVGGSDGVQRCFGVAAIVLGLWRGVGAVWLVVGGAAAGWIAVSMGG